jgi:hypothetical protein
VITLLHAPFNGVEEVPSYPTDAMAFWLMAVGGSFTLLVLIKHWRDYF